MRESISKAILETIQDLHKDKIVGGITMKNFESLCVPEVKNYTPEEIAGVRKKSKLSQAALASLFNISFSTVQKWEIGAKKPNGACRKLLDLMERKGIACLI